jgi:hypothetical protein
LVRWSEFVVFEGRDCEHITAGGTDWCILLASKNLVLC